MKLTQDWLPISFKFTARGASVRWLNFGDKDLSEPFFNQTVRSLRTRRPPADERITDVQPLLDTARDFRTLTPAGIIFHVSRCGSTLVANALKISPAVTVLSESAVVATLFRGNVFGRRQATDPSVREMIGRRRALLDAVITLYGHRKTVAQPRVVIKCPAASILQMAMARAIWPDVPFVVLIRDPLEVVVSNIAVQAGWVRARQVPVGERCLFGWPADEVHAMTLEEYAARGLRQFYDAAARQLSPHCTVVDYSALDAQRIKDIATAFDVDLPPAHSPAFVRLMGTYSKDVAGDRPFEADTERKHRDASATLKHVVDRWARESYETLRGGGAPLGAVTGQPQTGITIH
jgi:hypothetical protein